MAIKCNIWVCDDQLQNTSELDLLTTVTGDTKAGVLVGKDRYGNKYYENLEEDLPLRTRWVDYKDKELDASQMDPGWHAWTKYMVDKPPSEDPLLQFGKRPWESPETKVNLTLSRGAYRPYSTCVTQFAAWYNANLSTE